MTPIMRSLLLLAAVGTVVWILYKIRKLKVKMEDSIYWIFFCGNITVSWIISRSILQTI